MPVDVQRLSLFGLDLSRYVNYVRAGWRELTWGESTAIRKHLDAPVELLEADDNKLYIAEQPVTRDRATSSQVHHQALQLPSDMALLKSLRLPASLELELEDAIALEVHSSSPFPADNTCYGWALRRRSKQQLDIVVAIAERDAVNAWLQEKGFSPSEAEPSPANELPEVWVFDAQQKPVILAGFGEERRYREYSGRLKRFVAKCLLIFLCIALIAAVPVVVRKLQVDKMEGYLAEAEQEAAEAQALRQQLIRGNDQVESVKELLASRVDYHRVLEYLSSKAPDTVYLQRFQAEARGATLTGWSANAGAFMQSLSQDDVLPEVSTSSAFSRDPRTGLERFVLEIELPVLGGDVGGDVGEDMSGDVSEDMNGEKGD